MLVIDDQASVRVTLEYILLSAGYRVLTAESGAAAIALAQSEAIDGALIDIHMPVMNGFDTCIRLQAHAGALGRSLRFWFMTGAFNADLMQRGAKLGPLGFLSKPSDLMNLPDRLEKAFASSSLAFSTAPSPMASEPARDPLP